MKDESFEMGNKKKAPKKAASRPARKEPSGATQRSATSATPTRKKKPGTRIANVEQSPAAGRAARGARHPASMKITEEQRRAMVSERAYFKAERRGFVGGDPLRDWIEAEAEVDALILRGAGDD